jgi:hypothetical protein
MNARPEPFEFTEEWLEGKIVLISKVIIKHGAKYTPILDRLERELKELKLRGDPVNRARQHLARAQAAAAHAIPSEASVR